MNGGSGNIPPEEYDALYKTFDPEKFNAAEWVSIAKAAGTSELTRDGAVVGTARYLAPEQVEGAPVDARTDVYALGLVLYEMLCGQTPFDGDNETEADLSNGQVFRECRTGSSGSENKHQVNWLSHRGTSN